LKIEGEIEIDDQVELPKSKIELSDLKDKTLVFVNVASKCGTSLPLVPGSNGDFIMTEILRG
jgi:hypothetical protein